MGAFMRRYEQEQHNASFAVRISGPRSWLQGTSVLDHGYEVIWSETIVVVRRLGGDL
jgi:hypothetical protein